MVIPQLPKRPLPSAWLLLALLVLALPARAQPVLDVEPDTLRFPSEQEVLLTNTGTSPLQIDSLGISPHTIYGWDVQTGSPDPQERDEEYYLNSAGPPVVPLDTLIVANSVMALYVVGWDPCIICKRNSRGDSLNIVDTLFVYSSDPSNPGESSVDSVYLDVSTYVSIEETPSVPETAVVETFPNPFSYAVRVRVDGLRSGRGRLVVYDLLGQHVAEQAVRGPRGTHALRFSESASPGVYVLQVQEAGRGVATRRLVKLR